MLAPPIAGVCDAPFVAHYAPREHALELRARLSPAAWSALVWRPYDVDDRGKATIGILALDDIHAGHVSRDKYEMEADRFAAALLMPYAAFKAAARGVGDGLAGLEPLASACRTSLTATAIRYAECIADEPLAVVLAKSDEVQFCAMSARFKELRGITWLKKGDRVPRRSASYRLAADPTRIRDADREDGSVHLHDWFQLGPDLRLAEEAVGLGRSGQVLTILTVEDLPDDDEVEEEAALIESWTPRFRR